MIDYKSGIEHCAGSKEIYEDTLKSLLMFVPERLVHIKQYLEKEQYDDYIIEAHTLKSNAALIGAKQLELEAKELEYAGKNKEYEVLHRKTEHLIKHFEQLLDEITTLTSSKLLNREGAKNFVSKREQEECARIIEEVCTMLSQNKREYAVDALELLTIYEMPDKLLEIVKNALVALKEKKNQQGDTLVELLRKEILAWNK